MARLTTLAPRLRGISQSVAAAPPKSADPYYSSPEWKTLREAVLVRDGYVCVVPGCGKRATVVDHIVSRRPGGGDDLSNLRSLCRDHDNRFKENHLGNRRGGG